MRRFGIPRRVSVALFLALCSVAAAGAQEDANSIFGRQDSARRPIPAPVYVDGREVGTALVVPPDSRLPVQIAADDLVSLVGPFVDDSARDTLAGFARNIDFVGEEDLLGLGILMVFDMARLQLHVRIPGSLRPTRVLSARGAGPRTAAAEAALTPARFSGYLNASLSGQLIAGGVQPEAIVPVALQVEPVVQYAGYVLESSARVGWDSQWSFAPSYFRVVKDFSELALRLSVGDTLYRATGFQARLPFQGVAVDRVFAVSTDHERGPDLSKDIALDQPSTVVVWVNGRETFRASLPAGKYDLRDFALATGLNEVVVEIIEPDGTRESFRFDSTFDTELLARGTHDFSYVVGMPPFRLDVPSMSGFHRLGLSDYLTLGLNAQTDFSAVAAGIETLWASPLGVVRLDASGSVGGGDVGGAFALRYQYRKPGSQSAPSVGATIGYTGRAYQSPAGTIVDGSILQTQVSASYRIASAVAANLSVQGLFRPDAGGFTPGLSASVSGSPSLGTSMSLSTSFDFPAGERPFWEARVRWSSALIDRRTSVGFSQDLKRGTSAVQIQIPSTRPTRSVGVTAGIAGVPTDAGAPFTASAAGTYTARRFVADGAGRVTRIPGSDPQIISSVQLAAAMAFADGAFGLSRPITGSFALVDRNPKYREYDVGVNPTRNGYEAVADSLGPAVLPSIAAYTVSRMLVDSKTLPVGFDLGPSSYDLWPGYKSGHRITVGTAATVFISGRVVDQEGQPIVLAAGRLIGQETGTEFFTNRDGRFSAYGLSPGTYRITVGARESSPLVIPPEAEGAVDIGDIGVAE